MNYPLSSPLAVSIAHGYDLLRLMARSSLGACAFVDEVIRYQWPPQCLSTSSGNSRRVKGVTGEDVAVTQEAAAVVVDDGEEEDEDEEGGLFDGAHYSAALFLWTNVCILGLVLVVGRLFSWDSSCW